MIQTFFLINFTGIKTDKSMIKPQWICLILLMLAFRPLGFSQAEGTGEMMNRTGSALMREKFSLDTSTVMLKIQEQEAISLYNKGIELYRANELRAALDFFDRALSLQPDFTMACFNRGVINMEQQYFQIAQEDFSVVINAQPNANAYYYRARAKYESGDVNGAFDDYSNAIELDPTHLSALYYRGGVFFDNAEYDNAIRDLTIVINYDPTNARAWNDRGSAKRMLDDYDGALTDYNKAIELNDKSAFAFNNRGSLKRVMEDYAGAIADYSEAIRLFPEYYIAWNNRGTAKAKAGDYTGAIEDFNKAIKIAGDQGYEYAYPYINRGNARFKLGLFKEAIEDYDIAIAINSEYGPAYMNRGAAREAMADFHSACDDYKTAAELGVQGAENYAKQICK